MSDPFAGYDVWKTTPPEWIMPPWLRPDANELARTAALRALAEAKP